MMMMMMDNGDGDGDGGDDDGDCGDDDGRWNEVIMVYFFSFNFMEEKTYNFSIWEK